MHIVIIAQSAEMSMGLREGGSTIPSRRIAPSPCQQLWPVPRGPGSRSGSAPAAAVLDDRAPGVRLFSWKIRCFRTTAHRRLGQHEADRRPVELRVQLWAAAAAVGGDRSHADDFAYPAPGGRPLFGTVTPRSGRAARAGRRGRPVPIPRLTSPPDLTREEETDGTTRASCWNMAGAGPRTRDGDRAVVSGAASRSDDRRRGPATGSCGSRPPIDSFRVNPDVELVQDGRWTDYEDTARFKVRDGRHHEPGEHRPALRALVPG